MKAYADKRNNIEILNPCVTVTGNATPIIFDSIQLDDFETGMMQRFEFFCYDGPILRRKRGESQNGPDDVAKKINSLFSVQMSVDRRNTSPVDIGFDKEAGKLVDDWSDQITDDTNAYEEGGARGIVSRRYESSIKYAMIHHASLHSTDSFRNPLSVKSVQWGIELSELLADWKLNKLTDKITTGDFHKDCELFKDAIMAACRVKDRKRRKLRRPTFALMSNKRPHQS